MTGRLHPDDLAAIAQQIAALPREPAAPRLLTADEAAALLGVPASWVRAEARAARIPHVRLGKYVRFDAGELEVWWRSRARGPWRTNGAAARAAGAGPVAGRGNSR